MFCTVKTPILMMASLALAGSGCRRTPSGTAPEVIAQDRARIEGEAQTLDQQLAALDEQQRGISKQLEELRARRAKLAPGDAEGRAGLDREEDALWTVERQLIVDALALDRHRQGLTRQLDQLVIVDLVPPKAAAGAADELIVRREAGLAARERDLAQRERDLAVRERDLAHRERQLREPPGALAANPAPVPASHAKPRHSQREAELQHRRVLDAMQAKGLLPGDLPPDVRSLNDDVYAALRLGDYDRSLDLSEELGRAVAQIQVDQPFLDAKMRRISKRVQKAAVPQATAVQVDALLQEVTSLAADGQFGSANRRMNRIAALLQ